MDIRRRAPPPSKPTAVVEHSQQQPLEASPNNPKASDALPLPLYLTNGIFFTLFFSVAYFLLHRWRDKIRTSTPLHVLTLSELAAILSLIASFIYLLGFFGIDFVQSFIAPRPSHEHDHPCPWENVDLDQHQNSFILRHSPKPDQTDPDHQIDSSSPNLIGKVFKMEHEDLDDDEELVNSVVSGNTPSYSLESTLGDCLRAASIRREAVQRITGRSLSGMPLEGFDYDSILGQCCEMPVGYVQIPVGIAGPLLMNGCEYSVPMATTEGCLVASTNRGCKAIHASGGATSILLRDGMSRAPVVRFPTAQRATHLKFFLEDPPNFDTLALVFNK